MKSNPNLESVTHWIEQVKRGDAAGAHKIWNHFSDRLIVIANKRLRGSRTRVVDGEDIAIVAFSNFLDKAMGGFSDLSNRQDLWRILLTLTNRRAIDQVRSNTAQKNGGGDFAGESALMDSQYVGGLAEVPGSDSHPDVQLILTEEFDHRLESLGDELLREIALCRLSEMTYEAIGKRLKISARAVERKCRIIREIWESEMPNESTD
jgi:DNA-directed RNA polymerase specialized sigma24 family protein